MMQKHQLERNRFRRAFADAGTAFDAIIADLGNAVFNGDGADGAGTNASFATNAFFFINSSSHFSFSFSKNICNYNTKKLASPMGFEPMLPG